MSLALDEYNNPRYAIDGKRLYICDACGHLDKWGDTWGWYGSYCQVEDNPKTIIMSCSSECLVKLIADGKVPQEAWDEHKEEIKKPRYKRKL